MHRLEHVEQQGQLPCYSILKECDMSDPTLIQASELALVIILTMLIGLTRNDAAVPQFFGSVGWHGGKKKR